MRRLTTIAALLTLTASAQTLSPGFEHFYNLEYTEALREFQREVEGAPDDPNAYNHVAQAVLYREMLKAGALESELVSGSNPFLRRERMEPGPEAARQFADAVSKSMSLCQARLERNPKDITALYALGVAHGVRANYNFLVRKAWLDSLRDTTTSRKLHNKVVELDPSFVDARLVQGLHDYVVGSLPWHWKMLGFVAGFRGDRQGGIRTLQLVASKGNLNKHDAEVILAAVYRRERKPLDAIPLLKILSRRFPRNYLFRLEMVQMYSDAGMKDEALEVLAELESMKRSGTSSLAALPMEKIHFYRGNLLFWYRDFDGAIEQLKRVAPHTSALDLHTAVMAWLRLGQTLDMKGRRQEATAAYRQAIATAPESDAAKESKQYLNSPYRRS